MSKRDGLRFYGLGRFEPPKLDRTIIPTGPSDIRPIGDVNIGGPGQPPPGFIGGTNSVSEWYFYWALTKILGPEGNSWAYQQGALGSRHVAGGAVIDFVVYEEYFRVGIRIQTFYYHEAAGVVKQAYDFDQEIALSQNMVIIDVFEQDFIGDPTGQAVLRIAMDTLSGIQRPNPRATGIVLERGF